MSPALPPGRDGVTVRRFESHADADEQDLAYWRQVAPEDRVLLTWQLSVEQFRLSGIEHEPGLHRSVASVRRG